LRPPAQLEPEERAALDQILAEDQEVAWGYNLLQQFRRIMAERSVPALDDWLKVAEASQLAPFVSLATGLRNDREAVEAALKLKWSNGPTEGTVTRIKSVSSDDHDQRSRTFVLQWSEGAMAVWHMQQGARA
jgi:transposase